ncbi:M56 family metallopeptidase [Allofournierella massiliensis]|uniref:Beta-lactamase regulating signal transducer with metallopeptidase domain n=1 Tax=Allofournierella massiliensis TaxID=1650663 RepID=A0A4V2QB03_9FIRM|nr:M56 family metallopeptidase [Fournierella massiliensis]TCL54542.1 beta-lactamase regulating signal transducer with metallopeptidase domain [Fournierella massiliensis]
MIELLITSSLLILAVLAARALLAGRISRRMQYALWGLVLLRLLLPVSLPQSRASVMNALPDTAQVSLARPGEFSGETLPAPADTEVQTGTAPETDLAQTATGGMQAGISGGVADISGSEPHPEWSLNPAALLPLVWAAGAVLTGGALLWANLRFSLRLRRERCQLDLEPEITGGLPVYLCHELASPCLHGLLHPAIYLNPAALESPERLEFVLAHEKTHYRHRDHIWGALRCVLLAVYWFDPLVWWAAAASRRDCELACDEAVTAAMEEARGRDYGRCLVELIPNRARGTALLAATSMSGSAGAMQRRLKAIVTAKKPRRAAIALTLAGAVLLTACTFTGAKGITSARDYLAEGETEWKLCALGDESRMQELLVARAPAPEGEPLAEGEEYVKVYYWDSAAEPEADALRFAGKVQNGSLEVKWSAEEPGSDDVVPLEEYRGNEDPAQVQELIVTLLQPDGTQLEFTLFQQWAMLQMDYPPLSEWPELVWELMDLNTELANSIHPEGDAIRFTIPAGLKDRPEHWRLALVWTPTGEIERTEITEGVPEPFASGEWEPGQEYAIPLDALPTGNEGTAMLQLLIEEKDVAPLPIILLNDYQRLTAPLFSAQSEEENPTGDALVEYQAAMTAFSETVQWNPDTRDFTFTIPETAAPGEWKLELSQRNPERGSWVTCSALLPDAEPQPGETVTLKGENLPEGGHYRLNATNTLWNTTLSVEFE